MGLYERLAKAGENGSGPVDTIDPAAAPARPRGVADPLAVLRRRIHQALVKALGPALYDQSLSESQLEEQVRGKLTEVIAQDSTPLSAADRQRLIVETIDTVAVLAGRGTDRRLAELARVSGLNDAGDYALEPLLSHPKGHNK